MLLHLLKSSVCLAVFLLFYQIFLEKENMHHFKRYYLLATLLIALGIPFITFTEYVTAPPVSFQPIPFEAVPAIAMSEETSYPIWPTLLWVIYALGVLVFTFKFIKNLWRITTNIRNNPKRQINAFIRVLLKTNIIPHTFFRYIFLNKRQFEAHQIPEEVIVHEEAHAKQLHSIDVLLIELLQVLLWFNPLVYWAKYHIKLNHEFLADQAVLISKSDTTSYQNILVSFTEHHHQSLANAIIYSSNSSIRLTLFGKSFTLGRNPVGQVKKRFKVMKTRTSKKSVLIRSLILLPILALLVYGFSGRENIYQKSTTEMDAHANLSSECEGIEHHTIRLYENQLLINGLKFDTSMAWLSFLRTNYGGSSEEGLPNKHFILINEDNIEEDVEGILSAYSGGAWQVHESTSDQQPKSLYKKENKVPTESDQEEFAKIILQDDRLIKILVNKKGQLLVRSEVVELENLDSFLKKFNTHLSKEERQKSVRAIIVTDKSAPKGTIDTVENVLNEYGVAQIDIKGPENSSPTPTQKGATQEQIKEFNSLAKKYNAQPQEKRVVPLKDLKALERIYGRMTDTQKEKTQPFPECPEPPKHPTPPNSPKEASQATPPKPPSPTRPPNLSEKEIAENIIHEIIENQDPYDNLGNSMRFSSVIEKEQFIDHPPTPPSPKSPLDHITEMTKKNAQFYYEGKEISSDKAVDILKKNKGIKIETKKENGKRPVVKLSTAPK